MSYTQPEKQPRSVFWAGVRAELPIVVGVIPFGMIYGVLALAAGIPPLVAQAMSVVVFAGSAQFIGAQLIGVGTPVGILWLTTFVVNLRHMLYSASLSPYLQHLSNPWKWLLAYLLTDEAYVVAVLNYNDKSQPLAQKHYYFLGAGLTLWSSWQLSTAVGIFLGTQIPASWSLDFTLALTFIGMIVPTLTTRPLLATAVTASLVAILAAQLPYKLDLMAAAVAGISVGYFLEKRMAKR
jgi:4-azaleucine resistance transporter AzlC